MYNEAGDTNEVTEKAAQDTKEEEVKIRKKKLISENLSCNLNWRFIVKPKSPSPLKVNQKAL